MTTSELTPADARLVEGRIVCPLCDLLDELWPPEWEKWRRQNSGAGIWYGLEVHHPFRQRQNDERWNRLRTCGGCHKFSHAFPVHGTAAAMLLMDRAGVLMVETAAAALGKNPLGMLAVQLEDGKLSGTGRLEQAAADLCRRHSF
jgi:hypothetical protein